MEPLCGARDRSAEEIERETGPIGVFAAMLSDDGVKALISHLQTKASQFPKRTLGNHVLAREQ